METKFNFNSAICTTREQSERLLVLGLKKETADMVHYFSQSLAQDWTIVPLAENETAKNIEGIEIPAWSLHRLWELGKFMGIHLSSEVAISNLYEYAIARIETKIKEGYFNKEYLV